MSDIAGTPPQLASTVDRTRPGDPSAARSALAGFGAATLQSLLAGRLSNTAISPYSLFTVLAMARAGVIDRRGRCIDGGPATALRRSVATRRRDAGGPPSFATSRGSSLRGAAIFRSRGGGHS